MELYKLYHPVTAAPFQADASYREVLPTGALRPYIRCFWGTDDYKMYSGRNAGNTRLIIPDTCMDIIFTINATCNTISDSFYGIDDSPYQTDSRKNGKEGASIFGIRFYAWSAALFAEESMKNVCNLSFDAGQYFSKIKKELTPLLWENKSLIQRASAAERVLMRHFHSDRENANLLNAVYLILRNRGCFKALDIAGGLHISLRQLERICKENTGVSPKKLSSLVRYQYLWSDILYRPYRALDAVERYGYTDQAHLIRDFKRYHSMTPKAAREKAFSNFSENP